MGGQACVLYGAAQFSRDLDLGLSLAPEDLAAFEELLIELQAQRIAVPPFETDLMRAGHAVHFRCQAEEVKGLRIDVMNRMRGVDDFEMLWARRTTVEVAEIEINLLSLPDLVKAKKTQRDKDWPMIRRLIEAHYRTYREDPTPEQRRFWFLEAQTCTILLDLAAKHGAECAHLTSQRPLLQLALEGDEAALQQGLEEEERREREQDRVYWRKLKAELEAMRRDRFP